MFSCPFGRYRYIRLPFGTALTGNMFLKKMDTLCCGMPIIFGVADDILIADFDEQEKQHNKTLDKVLLLYS